MQDSCSVGEKEQEEFDVGKEMSSAIAAFQYYDIERLSSIRMLTLWPKPDNDLPPDTHHQRVHP